MSLETGGRVFLGVPASSGIAVGRAHVVDRRSIRIDKYHVDAGQVASELDRLERAIEKSVAQVDRVTDRMQDAYGGGPLQLLQAHRLLLTDPMLVDTVREVVEEDHINAEWALQRAVRRIKSAFDKVDRDYFRERRSDLDFVGDRVLRNLAGLGERLRVPPDEETVVVAHELSPVDTARLVGRPVLAFVTEVGGRTSHAAIMARALEIPAVLGLERITDVVGTGDLIVVDGSLGEVIVGPSKRQANLYRKRRTRWQSFEASLLENRDLPAHTSDGVEIALQGNIELLEEAPSVVDHGGHGVGLYRTEFLFLGRDDLPDEEEQLEAYQSVVRALAPNPVTLRTLDLGGDKFLSRLDVSPEMSSVLGMRAIRLCLAEPDIFRPQLRAMLRASAAGDLRILVPMVSDVAEVREVRALVNELRDDLIAEGYAVADDVPLGIMIEVPAAALVADTLAREADFFSIGTNDLIQYALAVDRANEQVAYLYNPLHPGVLRLIRTVVAAGNATDTPVAMCGEMAAEPLYIPVLLGLGLRTLSMSAHAIPRVKDVIRGVSTAWCEELAAEALTKDTVWDVEALVRAEVRKRFPGLVR